MNISELPPEERSAVEEFRPRIKDLIPKFKNDHLRHDLNLYRFLRARDFDLDKAEEMLRKTMKWREENDIDRILSFDVPEHFEEYFPVKVSGMNKYGYPVICIHIGGWDFRKAGGREGRKPFLTYVAKLFEQIMEFCRHVTTRESYYIQFIGIFDFEGFEYRQITSKEVIDLIREVIMLFEDNYPELPKIIHILNTPRLFQMVWNVIKPMLSPRTLSKIQIHGTNSDKYRPCLLETIDPDELPSQYGGIITSCFDYKFRFGLDAFPRYETLPESEMVTTEIPAGKKHAIDVDIQAAGTSLSWNFRTKEYDIGFKLDCNGDNVLKYCRVDAYAAVQKGKIICQKPGKYTLVFDNSYSSFKSKTLYHVVRAYME